MLIQLLPEQASRYWADIKGAVEDSLPPVVGMQSDRMSNILTQILTGTVSVWVSVEKGETVNTINGLILTTFVFDGISGTKSLLIYCIYGYGNIQKGGVLEVVQALQKFGGANECHRIIAYSDVPSVMELVESLGGETRYRLLSIPLTGGGKL